MACGELVAQADHKVMGWFTRTEEPMATLTADERVVLTRLEATVEAGVKASLTVLEAGKALAEIRTRQLFRDSAASWDQYVDTRFRITKRRADQMIAFAGVKDALDEMGTRVPILSEKAARPLVGLAPQTVAQVVAEAAGSPEGITPATIRKAAAKRKAKAKVRVPRPVRLKVPGAVVEIAFNAKAAGGGFNVQAALEAALEAARRQATEAA